MQRESMIDKIDLALYSIFLQHYGNDRDVNEGLCRELAEAALDALLGELAVSEDETHTISVKDTPSQSHGWQLTDTEDNDGWITWGGGDSPLKIGEVAELRFAKSGTYKYDSHLGKYFWEDKDHDRIYNVIAYRIIDEPKEEKLCPGCKVNLYQDVCACNVFETNKECCQCITPIHCYGGLEGKCAICFKEIRKQTLLEYANESTSNNLNGLGVKESIRIISKYLERNE